MAINYTMDLYAVITARTAAFTASSVQIDDYLGNSTIPITSIYGGVFADCATLKSVTLGGNLESINDEAFENCINLVSVDMSGSKISKIGDDTFKNCTALESISWSAALNQIGNDAFAGCTSIKSLDFGGTDLEMILTDAFSGCTSLSKVTLREGLSWIDNSAFAGTALKEVELPASLYLMQPTAFDSSVTLDFTGDATKVLYYWKDAEGGIYYDPVLPILLERNKVRIGQFFGEGLDKQSTYFKTTASAGLNVPNGTAAAGVPGGTGTVQGSVPTGTSTEQAADGVPSADISASENTGADVSENEEAEDSVTKIYEVVRDSMIDNPLLTVFAAAILALLIIAGGVRRYRKSRG